MRKILGVLFILITGSGCSASNSPSQKAISPSASATGHKIFAIFTVSKSWEEGVGLAQAKLRKGDANGELVNIGFFATDNQLFCNGDLFGTGSITHPDLWLFGNYDYFTNCKLKKGSKQFEIVLNMTEPGYEGVYISKIELPSEVVVEPMPFGKDQPMTTSDQYTVEWEPKEDPVVVVFEVMKWAEVYETPKYFDKIEQFFNVDPGEFVLSPEYIKDFPLTLSSQGRMNIYRKKIGQLDPKLDGEAYGHSWFRGQAFPLIKN